MSEDARHSRFSRMPLRGRLAVLTAAAVAVAVVLFAFASWFFAKQQMMNQVRDSLQQNAPTSTSDPNLSRKIDQWCAGGQPFDQAKTTPTVIVANGKSCPTNDKRAVVITQADRNVAKSQGTDRQPATTLHTGQTQAGTPVLVYTVSLGQFVLYDANGNPVGTTTAAVAFSASLEPVNHALTTLAIILATVALIVILGAAALAAWVARAALRPVDKLTEAVEHIARTEELGTTIPVEGKDEIARLSESFNSMSTALASSRERQSQLIADAGHELRTPLTSLRTNVDLLVRSEETGRALPAETHSRLLRNMKAQMGELSTLIGDLLELSRPARPKGASRSRSWRCTTSSPVRSNVPGCAGRG
ncbi:HAMP domain-containing protein [Streptacidiphilus monticola]